jgi:hypothetical protein
MKEYLDFTVEANGTMPVNESLRVKQILKEKAGKWLRFMITNERKRSIPQNSWLHAVITLISDFLRSQAREQGNEKYYEINPDTTKLWIKQTFLGYEEINKERHLRHTSKLTTIECNELFDLLQKHFSPLGLNLPDPGQTDFINNKIKTDRVD